MCLFFKDSAGDKESDRNVDVEIYKPTIQKLLNAIIRYKKLLNPFLLPKPTLNYTAEFGFDSI